MADKCYNSLDTNFSLHHKIIGFRNMAPKIWNNYKLYQIVLEIDWLIMDKIFCYKKLSPDFCRGFQTQI